MKKLIVLISIIFISAEINAQVKISGMSPKYTTGANDYYVIITDSTGSWTNRRLSYTSLKNALVDSLELWLQSNNTLSITRSGNTFTLEITDSSITIDKLSTALINYIDAAGGGTITNHPDDVTIENVPADTTLRLKDLGVTWAKLATAVRDSIAKLWPKVGDLDSVVKSGTTNQIYTSGSSTPGYLQDGYYNSDTVFQGNNPRIADTATFDYQIRNKGGWFDENTGSGWDSVKISWNKSSLNFYFASSVVGTEFHFYSGDGDSVTFYRDGLVFKGPLNYNIEDSTTYKLIRIPRYPVGYTDYFIDPVAGNDSNAGTSPSTAWASFDKLEELANSNTNAVNDLSGGDFETTNDLNNWTKSAAQLVWNIVANDGTGRGDSVMQMTFSVDNKAGSIVNYIPIDTSIQILLQMEVKADADYLGHIYMLVRDSATGYTYYPSQSPFDTLEQYKSWTLVEKLYQYNTGGGTTLKLQIFFGDIAAAVSGDTCWINYVLVPQNQSSMGGLAGGDGIFIKKSTTLNDSLSIKYSSGTSGIPIVLSSYGAGSKPLIDCLDTYNTAVELLQVKYFYLSNLHVRNSYQRGIVIDYSGDSVYTTLKNIEIDSIGPMNGTFANEVAVKVLASYVNIIDCYFHDTMNDIINGAGIGWVIKGTDMILPAQGTTEDRGDCIHLFNSPNNNIYIGYCTMIKDSYGKGCITGSDSISQGGVIEHNYFEGGAWGVGMNHSGLTIRYNYATGQKVNSVTGLSGEGFSLRGGVGSVMHNNIVYNSYSGLKVGGLTKAYNNTIVNFWGIGIDMTVAGDNDPEIYSNLLYTTYTDSSYLMVRYGADDTVKADYNLYYSANLGNHFGLNGVDTTFAVWQANGYDLQGLTQAPNVDMITFYPDKNSIAINRGGNKYHNIDYYGRYLKSLNTTIGAVWCEYY